MSLEARSVSHSFGQTQVLHGVSINVSAGEVHCLLGPSGSGKSTLLRLIAGLEQLQRGTIALAGRTLAIAEPGASSAASQLPPEQRPIGFVFQDYALFPHLNVLRNVMFGMSRPARDQPDRREERAQQLLADVDLAAFAQAMPHTLSGGQQQRVALARALARGPEVMLLDEPFSGLDERLRADVRERTMQVLRASGVATVIVTHDPQEARLVGDAISVIEEGRLLQTGSVADVVDASASVRVAEVFGTVNTLAVLAKQEKAVLPWGDADLGGASHGERWTAMVRAEHLLLEALNSDGAPLSGAAQGRVVSVRPSHGAVEVSVELEPEREGARLLLRAIDLVRASWQVGDQVAVSAAPEVIMWAKD